MVAHLTDLISRVEASRGPDREIDADLDIALRGGELQWRQANYTMEMYPVTRRPSQNHLGGFEHEQVPLYTASIDASLALAERLLPGWQYALGTCNEDDLPWCCITEPDDPCRDFVGIGPSLPLAIILATLRSLSAGGGR